MSAYYEEIIRLWRLGEDTHSIWLKTGVPERLVVRRINEERSARRGLPSPYDRPVRMSA